MHSFFTLVSPLHALIDNGYVFIRYRGGCLDWAMRFASGYFLPVTFYWYISVLLVRFDQ